MQGKKNRISPTTTDLMLFLPRVPGVSLIVLEPRPRAGQRALASVTLFFRVRAKSDVVEAGVDDRVACHGGSKHAEGGGLLL